MAKGSVTGPVVGPDGTMGDTARLRPRRLTPKDRDTLEWMLVVEGDHGVGIFPRGAGQWARFRKLARWGLIVWEGFCEDEDGEVEGEVYSFRLTAAGRAIAEGN